MSGPDSRRAAVLWAVALGGAGGAVARHGIGLWMPAPPGAFPWGTFAVNVSGAAALGYLLTLVLERWPPTVYVRPFAGIGFLGAYTTFSTLAVEADLLVRGGHATTAAVYACGSVVAGLAAVTAGVLLGRKRPAHGRSAR